jgi:hypothetical protein
MNTSKHIGDLLHDHPWLFTLVLGERAPTKEETVMLLRYVMYGSFTRPEPPPVFEGAVLDPEAMLYEHIFTYGIQAQRYWLSGKRRPNNAPDYIPMWAINRCPAVEAYRAKHTNQER